MKKTVLLLLSLFTLCLPASQASAYLIDTGDSQGASVSRLYNDGQNAQYLAAEFTLGQPSTIIGIEGYMVISLGGILTFKIYNDDSVSGEIPGTPTGFSQDGSFTPVTTSDWQGVSGLNWSLGPGTYWVAFEPQKGFAGGMRKPSLNPLINEAYYDSLDGRYEADDTIDIGIRIAGDAVPLPGAVLLLGAGLLRLGLWSRSGKG